MTKDRIALILLALAGLPFLITPVLKIIGAEEAAEGFGNANAPYILAVVQLLILAALVIPRTRLLGIILAASYYGGVIAFSWLVEKETPIVGIALNTILYVGAALYRPFLRDNGQG